MSNLVVSSQDIVKGKVGDNKNKGSAFTQPLQFLSYKQKDEQWSMQNLDFLEFQGLRQILRKAPRFSKNYNLAQGIIDRSDYIGSGANENQELLINIMSQEEESHLDLNFILSYRTS